MYNTWQLGTGVDEDVEHDCVVAGVTEGGGPWVVPSRNWTKVLNADRPNMWLAALVPCDREAF